MFMMMALAKRGAELHAMVKDDQWNERLEAVPFDLYGKTVLVVGFGRIGTRSAKRCQAMEMNVLVYDPYVPAATIKAAGCEPVADLDAALPARRLRHDPLPQDAGDGRHVQRRAARAHEAHRLPRQHRPRRHHRRAGAACRADGQASSPAPASTCSLEEPTPADNPLLKLANVIWAPHMAGVTRESLDRMGLQTAKNIMSVLDGTPIRENVINKEVLG